MYKILALNKISKSGTDRLPAGYTVSSDVQDPDGIILRSFVMHEMELPPSLKAVARAGAGVNNIPIDKCSEQGVVVFNTPGANANAVKEMIIAALLLSSRKITEGINWTQSLKGQTGVAALVEKGKGDFVGPEIAGKKLGVIGLGAIGVLVANVCTHLGMEVVGYDPYMSLDSAWNLSRSVKRAASYDQIYESCDYITIHVPMTAETKGMINTEKLAKMKKDVRILNFSRGEIVDNAAIIKAVENGAVGCYVTDFPDETLLGIKNIITIPHLAASTPESEDNCAAMAADELREYLEYGTIKNSVNYPDCDLAYTGLKRVCVLHKNVPNMVASITSVMAKNSINISNMINKSKGAYAYTVIDLDSGSVDGIDTGIMEIDGVIKVRVI